MFSWARWLAVVYPGLFPTLPQVVAGGLEPEWGSFHPCLPTFFCKEAATAVLLPQCSLIQSPRNETLLQAGAWSGWVRFFYLEDTFPGSSWC